MGLGDSIRNFFSRRQHQGVEGYVEPQTTTQPTTLLLVDRIGANFRGEVRDPADAAAFCDALGIPVYDAAVVGYPRRMRDYERGRRASTEDLDAQIADLEQRLDDPGPPAPDN